MISNDNTYRNVWGPDAIELRQMRDYLLGAVQVWCRDRHGEWFAARDLLGGANRYWQGTPLMALYDYYLSQSNGDDDYAFHQAARAAGNLLKRVLVEDEKRSYETRKRFTREYRWIGAENIM